MYELSELRKLLAGIVEPKEEKPIVYLRDLVKAGKPGKKDITKLTKKNIVNKRGHRQTVYVLPAGKPEEKKEGKKTIIDVLSDWFGLPTKREIAGMVKGEYTDKRINELYGVDVKEFSKYLVEYFNQKSTWDKHFTANPNLGVGSTKIMAKVKKGADVVERNVSLVRFLYDQYGKTQNKDNYDKYREKLKEPELKESDVDPKELEMGIKVEMEHTTDKETARTIALHHLAEIPNYYSALTKMEEENKPDVAPKDELTQSVEKVKELLETGKKKKKRAVGKKEKPKKEKKPTELSEESKRYQEVGEHVWGTRADIASLLQKYKDDIHKSVNLSDIEELEKTNEAGRIVTRDRQFGDKKSFVDMMKKLNAESSAAYLTWRIISSIKRQPEDDPESRRQFLLAADRFIKMIMNWTSYENATDGLDTLKTELDGLEYTEDELNLVNHYDEENSTLSKMKNDIWRSEEYTKNPKYWTGRRAYSGSFRGAIASGDFYKDPRISKIEKEMQDVWELKRNLQQTVTERTKENPNSINNLFKTFGKDFYSVLGELDSYKKAKGNENVSISWSEEKKAQKRYGQLLKSAVKNDDWKWAGGIPEEGGEKKPKIKGVQRLRWERIVPDKPERKTKVPMMEFTTSDSLKKEFGLVNVQYGNYVDNLSRKTHVQRAGEALADMAYLFNIPNKFMSFNGRMSLAFGARGVGHAAAHYEPAKKIINITKENGGGSLAHEWGHALDNVMAMLSYDVSGTGRQLSYVSEQEYAPAGDNLPQDVRDAYSEVGQAISVGNFRPAKEMTVTNKSFRYTYSANPRYDIEFYNFINNTNHEKLEQAEIHNLIKEGFNSYMAEKGIEKTTENVEKSWREIEPIMKIFENPQVANPANSSLVAEQMRRLYQGNIPENINDYLVEKGRGVSWENITEEQFKRFMQKRVDDYSESRKKEIYDDNGNLKSWYARYDAKDWDTHEKKAISMFKKHNEYFISKYFTGDASYKSGLTAEVKARAGKPVKLNFKSIYQGTGGVTHFVETANRLGEYWRRPRELFARAFESYVYDKLKDKGMKNSYLVSGVSKEMASEWGQKSGELEKVGGITSVYPLAEERIKINAAFDKLMSALSKHKMLEKATRMLERFDLLKSNNYFGHSFKNGLLTKN